MLICVCLRILASSRIPRYDLGRQTPHFLGGSVTDNLSTHVWSPEIVQMIIDSSCLSFEIAPASLNREDLSHFFMVAWAIHPNLIPMEVGCMVPESKGEPIVSLWPLFLRADEIVHS
jgi:hypothetical protein